MICRFRNLMEKHDLRGRVPDEVNLHLGVSRAKTGVRILYSRLLVVVLATQTSAQQKQGVRCQSYYQQ